MWFKQPWIILSRRFPNFCTVVQLPSVCLLSYTAAGLRSSIVLFSAFRIRVFLSVPPFMSYTYSELFCSSNSKAIFKILYQCFTIWRLKNEYLAIVCPLEHISLFLFIFVTYNIISLILFIKYLCLKTRIRDSYLKTSSIEFLRFWCLLLVLIYFS